MALTADIYDPKGRQKVVLVDSNGNPIFRASSGAIPTENVNPELFQTSGPITLLNAASAPGASGAQNCQNFKNHTVVFTVATIETNVVVELLGSVDGVTFATIPLDNTAVATCAITLNRATITANGSYVFTAKNTKFKEIKANFVSESGSPSTAVVSAVYHGGN
jgi:hypothetical protein